jgi:hypothetical protein
VGLVEVLLSLCREALCRGSLVDTRSLSLHPFLSSVAGYIFVGCIFFLLYVRCRSVSGGQKTSPFCTDRIEVILLFF